MISVVWDMCDLRQPLANNTRTWFERVKLVPIVDCDLCRLIWCTIPHVPSRAKGSNEPAEPSRVTHIKKIRAISNISTSTSKTHTKKKNIRYEVCMILVWKLQNVTKKQSQQAVVASKISKPRKKNHTTPPPRRNRKQTVTPFARREWHEQQNRQKKKKSSPCCTPPAQVYSNCRQSPMEFVTPSRRLDFRFYLSTEFGELLSVE